MRNWFKTTIAFLGAFVIAGALSSSVFGVASFARQTGLDCTSCHGSAPGFPALNSFGAAFKAGGYVMGNDDEMVGDGEDLSIPPALNISVVTKVRAKMQNNGSGKANATSNTTTYKTETPDEFAVFMAGRVGKNVGFVAEYAEGHPLSFKIPIVFDIGPAKLGIVPWWTDAFGPAWVMETSSTGAVRNIRATEDRATMSAFSALGWGGISDHHGLGLYVWHPMAFVAYTPFTVPFDGSTDAVGAHYIRAAATPSFGGLETLVGFAYYTGMTEDANTNRTNFNSVGVDLQVMGNVGVPLAAFVTYFTNLDVAGSGNNDQALSIYVEAGVLENVVNVGIGYRWADFTGSGGGSIANGAYTTSVAAGDAEAASDLLFVVKYNIVRNLKVTVDFAYNIDHGAYTLMPMLFGSF